MMQDVEKLNTFGGRCSKCREPEEKKKHFETIVEVINAIEFKLNCLTESNFVQRGHAAPIFKSIANLKTAVKWWRSNSIKT